MKNVITFILFLFSSSVLIAQTQYLGNDAANSQFQKILKDVAYGKVDANTEIDGNKYLYKKPQEAVINLSDGYKPIRIKTNYNIIKETFEIESEDGTLNLRPDKVNSISFSDANFIVYQGNFYKLITKTKNFSIIKSIVLIAVEPDYQVGIQDKPNLRYKNANKLYIQIGAKKTLIKVNKKYISRLFEDSQQGEIKKFFKAKKISIRDDADLKLLFDAFQDNLK